MQTIIAIDIGNTNVKLGIFRNGGLLRVFRAATTLRKTGRYGKWLAGAARKHGLRGNSVSCVAVASVVPGLNRIFGNLSEEIFGIKAVFLRHNNAGIKIRYGKPSRLGADRLACAIAAHSLFGGPLLVINSGTALTFDFIDSKGGFAGGLILPGIDMSLRALNQFTAKLPRVEAAALGAKPRLAAGSTEEAIKSGAYYGYEGILRNVVEKARARNIRKIIFTGGLVPGSLLRAAGLSGRGFKAVKDLPLQGLHCFCRRSSRIKRA